MPTVTGFLTDDHRRLDAILAEALGLAARGDFASARARYGEFASGLDRHIDMEERVLFPAFEAASGMRGSGPTEVMRHEHVEIRRLLAALRGALAADDGAEAQALAVELDDVLGPHNHKEERILYPMSDQFAGEQGGGELVRRMQSI